MAVDKKELRQVYIAFLEEDIIKEVATTKGVDYRVAMERYYESDLCQQIGNGAHGIEYMDYKYLANDLIENEPELFSRREAYAPLPEEREAFEAYRAANSA